jgi:hypothetical protein
LWYMSQFFDWLIGCFWHWILPLVYHLCCLVTSTTPLPHQGRWPWNSPFYSSSWHAFSVLPNWLWLSRMSNRYLTPPCWDSSRDCGHVHAFGVSSQPGISVLNTISKWCPSKPLCSNTKFLVELEVVSNHHRPRRCRNPFALVFALSF